MFISANLLQSLMTRLVVHTDFGLLQRSAAVVVIVDFLIVVARCNFDVVYVQVFSQRNPLDLVWLLMRSDGGIEFVFDVVVGSFRV